MDPSGKAGGDEDDDDDVEDDNDDDDDDDDEDAEDGETRMVLDIRVVSTMASCAGEGSRAPYTV
eukprot:493702-Prorocentrum_minimum.AAC.1